MSMIFNKIKDRVRRVLGIKKLEREINALSVQQDLLLRIQRESLKASLFRDSIAHRKKKKNIYSIPNIE